MAKHPVSLTEHYLLKTPRFPLLTVRLSLSAANEGITTQGHGTLYGHGVLHGHDVLHGHGVLHRHAVPHGQLRLFGFRIPLRTHRIKPGRLLFLLSAGPFDLELEIHPQEDGSLTGFLDTPLGLIPLTGHRRGRQKHNPGAPSLSVSEHTQAHHSLFAPKPLPPHSVVFPMEKFTPQKSNRNGMHFTYLDEAAAFICLPFGVPYLGDRLRARIGKHLAFPMDIKRCRDVDVFGPCTRWDIRYQSPVNPERSFLGRVFLHEGFAVFESEQLFSVEGKEEKNPFGFPYISFPSFEGERWQDGLSVLTYKRQAPFHPPVRWRGRLCDSYREGRNLPLIATDDTYHTIVLSPLSPLLQATVSIRHVPPEIRCGLSRSLQRLPEGTICRTLIVWGHGVNTTLDRWGDLLGHYHEVKPISPDADILLEKISYWTNAGSAYWYNTFGKTSYEKTLEALRKRHDAVGLRFGSYQLDSWWYQREHEGYTGGILEWAPRKETARRNYNNPLPFQKTRRIAMFTEDRLSRAQELLNAPLGCHFKQIANSSPYVAADPDGFLCEDFALPRSDAHAESLFRQLFTHPRWRLAYVVHDWLQWMSDRHSAFRDPDIGPGYFRVLDKVLQEIPAPDNKCGHVTLQLCMTQPSMALNAVSMPSVTTIRSTPDSFSFFVEGPRRWWWHLFSARLITALGKHAFYDNRPSGRRRVWSRKEFIEMELRWICLSGGPVGFGDAIGRENPERIAHCVLPDGTLLKPALPAKPLDRCFLLPNPQTDEARTDASTDGSTDATADELSRTGLIVSARDEVRISGQRKGKYDVLYLLGIARDASGQRSPLRFALREAGAQKNRPYALLHLPSLQSELVDPDIVVLHAVKGFGMFQCIAAPLLGGLAFFGDVSKHVSANCRLLHEIHRTPGHWRIHGCFAGNAPSRWVFHTSRRIWTAKLNGLPLPCHWNGQTLILEAGKLLSGEYILELFFEETEQNGG